MRRGRRRGGDRKEGKWVEDGAGRRRSETEDGEEKIGRKRG